MTPTGQVLLEASPNSARSARPDFHTNIETATVAVLFTTMAFAPLAFGAVEVWSSYVMEMLLAVVALLLITGAVLKPTGAYRNQAALSAMLFIALVFIQVGFGLSLYRHVTYVESLKVLSYGIGFAAALQCLRNSDRLRQFTIFMAIFGFALALLALAQHFTSPDKLYWYRTPSQGGTIFGPYVNRNHYAGLMEMLTPFAVIGFLVPYMRREKRTLMLFSAALMGASLVLSLSRGGLISLAIALVFLGAIIAIGTRHRRAAFGILGLVLPVIALVFWLSSTGSLQRFTTMEDWMRVAITRDGLRIFSEHLAIGTGLGTFPTIYPQFRSFPTDYFVNQAHNDVVQLMVETGLPGLLIVLWFLVSVYRRGLAKTNTWMTSWKGAASLAALTGITSLLVHSLLDFNLRIPANALFFCILCGVAAAQERDNALMIENSPRFRRARRSTEE